MKYSEKQLARKLRKKGYSIKDIAKRLGVSKSSVSVWVRDISLTPEQVNYLAASPHTLTAIEKRRVARLVNEERKRNLITLKAKKEIISVTHKELWLMGIMLYWAEGGKTQRTVRFSNGDPEMIKIMMRFFRNVCHVPEKKFRGYIHIHPHLDPKRAEAYWSTVSGIPLDKFFKTYQKPNASSQNKKDTLPYGVMDIYVLDTKLFLKIVGWSQGIFEASKLSFQTESQDAKIALDARVLESVDRLA